MEHDNLIRILFLDYSLEGWLDEKRKYELTYLSTYIGFIDIIQKFIDSFCIRFRLRFRITIQDKLSDR